MDDEVKQKTPLEVVAETLEELREHTTSSPVLASAIFTELKKNGYVIAKARIQWRH